MTILRKVSIQVRRCVGLEIEDGERVPEWEALTLSGSVQPITSAIAWLPEGERSRASWSVWSHFEFFAARRTSEGALKGDLVLIGGRWCEVIGCKDWTASGTQPHYQAVAAVPDDLIVDPLGD